MYHFTGKKYYSLEPEDWQRKYITDSLKKVNEFFDINLTVVSQKSEADYSVAIAPLPDNNFLSAGPEKEKGDNWIYISHQAGLFTQETNLDSISHDAFSKKMQKATFVHELGHLLGLEHPYDTYDGDVIEPYYPENFSYIYNEPLFPYESTLMGWNGSYVHDTNYEDIWFQQVDIKALREIWGESSARAFSGKNDISTTCFLFSIIVFKVLNPMKPGTAEIIKSYSCINFSNLFIFDKSE